MDLREVVIVVTAGRTSIPSELNTSLFECSPAFERGVLFCRSIP